MRLLMLAVLASFAVPADAADNMSVSLRYRSYRKWSLNLPAEKWFKVNDGIRLDGGEKFAAQLEGERLRFDTDGDGEIDRTIKATVDRDTKVSTARVILTGKDNNGEPMKYAVRLRKDAAGWEWAPVGPWPEPLKRQRDRFPFASSTKMATVASTTSAKTRWLSEPATTRLTSRRQFCLVLELREWQ